MSPGRVELSLLGDLRMGVAGAPLEIPSRKARALLGYLALPVGRSHARGHLCGLLWGDSAEARARNSLRQALFSLRRALPEALADALRPQAGQVCLDPALVTTDVAMLERAATQPIETAAPLLTELCEGELLSGLGVDEEGFEGWLRGERERVRVLQVEQLCRLAAHCEQLGRLSEATAVFRRVLRLEPWGEAHHQALMLVYARMGRRTALLRQYQECVAALRRELDTRPSDATRALHERWAEPAGTPRSPQRDVPALKAPPLFGRQEPLSRLCGLWSEAERGAARVVLVSGEAGVGKSALARALCGAVGDAHVLFGRAFETEQVLGLSPWAEAIRSDPRLFGEPLWTTLDAPVQAAALSLVPGAATTQLRDPATPEDGDQLRRLFQGLEGLLRALSMRAALLVVLDDVHWADDLSLRLLSFVGRRLSPHERMMIVVTERTGGSSARPSLASARDELRAAGRLIELSLPPLDRSATEAFSRSLGLSSPDAAQAASMYERLWRLSEGNPFVIEEAVRGMAAGQADPDLLLPMPARVRALVLRHLQALHADDRSLVSLSAVLGREFGFSQVESLWRARGRDEATLGEAIERLVDAGVFRCTDDRCYFTHDRIREVTYDALLPPRRRALHREVARALSAERDGAGRAAYHFARAGDPDSACACLLRQAEDAARRFGLGEALLALDQAADLVGAVDAARQPDLRVRIATHRAGYLGYLGRLGEVEACLAAERDQLQQLTDPRLRAIYFSAVGYTHSLVGHGAAAAQAGQAALAAALKAEDRRTERRALSLLAYAAAHSGRYAEGLSAGRSAVVLSLVPETDPEHAVLACCNLALNQLHSGDCRGALASLGEGQTRADVAGLTRERAFVLAFASAVHAAMGELAQARQASEQALSLASDAMSSTLAGVHHLLVHVAMGGGASEFVADQRDLPALLEQVERAGNRHWLGQAHLFAARAHLADGAARPAQAHAARARALFEDAGDPRGVALAEVAAWVADARTTRSGTAPLTAAIALLEQHGAALDVADAHLAAARVTTGAQAQLHVRAATARYQQLGLAQRAAAAEALLTPSLTLD